MANYLYKTTVYTDTNNVLAVPANNSTNLADYENNHQSNTVKITDLQLADTTFGIDISYSDFDSLVASPYDWTDVREWEHNNRYDLYIITSEPL